MKKLTLAKLIEQIKGDMPEDYNTHEQIAFIEVAVAKTMAINEHYLFGDKETQERIRELAKQKKLDEREPVRRKLIGPTMTQRFGYVLKNLGFEVRYQGVMSDGKIIVDQTFEGITEQTLDSICVQIKISENFWMTVDIASDLSALQTSSLPTAFGEQHSQFDKDYLRKTFKKVYGLADDEKFLSEHIGDMAWRLKLEGKKSQEIMIALFEDERVREQLKNLESIEAQQLCEAILMCSYEEMRDTQRFASSNGQISFMDECILSDGEKKRYSFYVYARDLDQSVLYVYSKKAKKMVALTPEQVKALQSKFQANITLRSGENQLVKRELSSYTNQELQGVQNDANSTELNTQNQANDFGMEEEVTNIFGEPDEDYIEI